MIENRRQTRPRTAAAVLVAGLAFAALTLGATPAGAVGLSVSPSSGLAPGGQGVTVSGSGFQPNIQVYVTLCDPSKGPGVACDYAHFSVADVNESGSFSIGLTLVAQFGSTDCTVTPCAIQTSKVGDGADRSQEGTAAVSFAAAAPPPPPPPAEPPPPVIPPAAPPAAGGSTGSGSTASGSSAASNGSSGVADPAAGDAPAAVDGTSSTTLPTTSTSRADAQQSEAKQTGGQALARRDGGSDDSGGSNTGLLVGILLVLVAAAGGTTYYVINRQSPSHSQEGPTDS